MSLKFFSNSGLPLIAQKSAIKRKTWQSFPVLSKLFFAVERSHEFHNNIERGFSMKGAGSEPIGILIT